VIQLTGQRIVLRTLEREHCRQLWASYDPDPLMPTEPLNPGLSVEGADRWFEEMQAKQGKEQVYLGVFTHEGRLVGDIQLAAIDWRHRTASLGCAIARCDDRNQGYGTDASLTMLHYAFDQLDLVRASVATAEYNRSGRRCLEKLGFLEEGRERQAIYCGGQRWDRIHYGLLRTDRHLSQAD
jgi:RimJ/RimL family protein N-acetyltransferase